MKNYFPAILFLSLFGILISGEVLPAETARHGCSAYNEVSPSDTITGLIRIKLVKDSLPEIDAYYGLQFFQNGILFMEHSKQKFQILADYVSFGDFNTYYVPLRELDLLAPEPFTKKTPFPYPPGAMTFSEDNHTVYFTKSEKDLSGKIKYKIYSAFLDTAKNSRVLGHIQSLSFCTGDFSCMQPSVSTDGKTMIFVSDNPDIRKGWNLFRSVRKGSVWSKPESLGPEINSDADELFPYLDDYNNLFFSSDRSPGSGFDIYFCPFNGSGWEAPQRMEQAVNTSGNEMMFRVRHNDTLALLVSFPDSGRPVARFYGITLSDSLKYRSSKAAGVILQKDTMETVRTAVAPEVVIPNEINPPPPEMVVAAPVIQPTPEPEPEPEPAPLPEPTGKKYKDIVFKVQIVASMIPSGSYAVWINHKKYMTWEYFYKGAYRYTIGEFDNVEDALKLKALCRQQGFPEAFVAAFRNNKRVLDPEVFKH